MTQPAKPCVLFWIILSTNIWEGISMYLYAASISGNTAAAAHDSAHCLLQRAFHLQYPSLDFPIISRDSHGKPYFVTHPDIHFNLSHCDGLALCGISNMPLGVDAERIRPFPSRVLQRSFSHEESQAILTSSNPDNLFFQHWTLKESYVKAIGIGISYPLQQVSFSINSRNQQVGSSVPNWKFGSICYKQNWAVSYCIAPNDTFPVHIIFLP